MNDNGNRNSTSKAVGLCLLPSELIEDILLRLALPDIIRLKSVSQVLTSIISSNYFSNEYNTRSSTDNWLFVYTKRLPRDYVLYGYTDRLNRWFKIPIANLLSPIVPPGEDLYFLAASGAFFLFASNNRRELIVVNLTLNRVRKIPPCPLGPRDTSSWRRSGLKLIAEPPSLDRFRFMFAELYQNEPILYEYVSETGTWSAMEPVEVEANQQPSERTTKGSVILSVINRRVDSILLAVNSSNEGPIILSPRFNGGNLEGQLAIGFSIGEVINQLHVYGDGYMVIVRSEGLLNNNGSVKMRVFTCIEIWGVSLDGRSWEFVSKVPQSLLGKVRRPYGVMMGCLEERNGEVKVVLVTNCEGVWDLIWLCYCVESGSWKWVQLPEFRTRGLNMAGTTFSSGPTL